MTDENENVLDFPVPAWRRSQNEVDAEFDEQPLRLTRRDYEACRHRQSVVDQAARTVTCATCKVSLDALDVLADIAAEPQRLIDGIKWARKEVAELDQRKADLERWERNAKSRIRTARRGRDDLAAMEAAARAHLEPGTAWGSPSPERLDVLIARLRPACEAYLAALAANSEHLQVTERSG